ncbi:Exopolygalacturonase X [Cytospora mali]|uniref:galacturonan 1,4-alpha-galacturonidase n=1 Tax=Cytospora mali TaxID=578113 RepID=A0A194UVQ7_CYTMA|nr:Exopolygalacturonase X [Valsa mali var. pyri (nom. inval.)]
MEREILVAHQLLLAKDDIDLQNLHTMRSSVCTALLASVAGVTAVVSSTSSRPEVIASPFQPRLGVPSPPERTKTCYVKTNGNGTDDSDNILSAFNECNNGGHVIFDKNTTYTIGTYMDWTFLKSIDIDIRGTIKFTDDTDYWQEHSYKFIFQNATSFFKLGGDDVFIYGGGTLDGSGQVWYDLYAEDKYILRPVLIGIDGLNNSILTDLNLRYSPMYYVFMANATDVVFNNININGDSTSSNVAKNTDGWDTYRSSDITIMNSWVNNGDDCVSFKPNSTNILVESTYCNGSHGISVGSLGQYKGEYDIVENVYVANMSMHNSGAGARIKVWPNTQSALSGDLQGGGGDGHVKNITYDGMFIDNVDLAIQVTQCYGQKNTTLCLEYPSPLTISDIYIKNFNGTTSKKYSPEIASFACSSAGVCDDIFASNINVSSPSGTAQAYCLNMNETALAVKCTSDELD